MTATDLHPCVGLWPARWFERHRRVVVVLESLYVGGDEAHLAAQSVVASAARYGPSNVTDTDRREVVGTCLEALGALGRRVRGAV